MQTYSLIEVANIMKVTRQAIYLQKKKGKINTTMINGKPRITLAELVNFKARRYSREYRFSDELISAQKAAEMSGITLQRIYYLIYNKKLEATKKNGMWYIEKKAIEACDVFRRVRGNRVRKIYRPVKARVRLKHLKALDHSKQREKQD